MTEPRRIPDSGRPSPQQIATTIALLADDAGVVQASARERLVLWGDAAVAQLETATESDSMLVRLRSRAVLRAIEMRKDLRRFGRLQFERHGRGSAPVLLEGAVLLSRLVRTFVPGSDELGRKLRRHALALKREFSGRSLPTCARLLAERLHDELGLAGVGSGDGEGEASVLELDHVLLHGVIARGTGIPVSLSLIYLLVARWAGLSVSGVALPDHFLVRLHGVRPVLVDPFHAGRTITKADCSRYLRASGHEQVRHHLRDLDDREVLVHYLRALQRAASYRAVPEARRALGRALTLLEPA
ncbi:MAG: transglutaminase family protein [Planctomycetes bacterium]|nr:transglutaminase family protein [Planctomycetota bacterium]